MRMYAVIRAGGKQYRVAPGDVVRVEKLVPGTDGVVEFPVLAVSSEAGQVSQQADARVVGEVVEEGRGAKILSSITSARSSTRSCAGIVSRIPRCASRRLLPAGRASKLRS